MKKSVFFASIIAAATLFFTGCPKPADPDVTPVTLTEKMNVSGDVDFANVKIVEDAAVNKAKKISNLDMGGKTLTVNVSGVTLSNLKNVNVIAAKGIGSGDLFIEDSEILELQILGGGANSIHLKDTKANSVSVEKEGVRLALEGTADIAKVELKVDDVKVEAEETSKISVIKIEEEVTGFEIDCPNIGGISAEGVDAEVLAEGIKLPSVGNYAIVKPCAEGIKIILTSTDTHDHYLDNLGSISVNGNPVHIDIAKDSNGSLVTEYVYPFVEKDKNYIVQFSGGIVDKTNPRKTVWVSELLKVKAGGGISLSDYITDVQLELYGSIKPEIVLTEKPVENWWGEVVKQTTFKWGFKQNVTNAADICNLSKVASVGADTSLVLGEIDWQDEASWYGGQSISSDSDGNLFVVPVDENNNENYGGSLNLFEAAKTNSVPFIWGDKTISEADWAQHDNHYCSSFTFKFKLAQYTNYQFSLYTLWSDLYTYHKDGNDYKEYAAESDKNLDLDAALKDGIKNVSAEGFIKSQDDLFAVVMESVDDLQSVFGSAEPELNGRAIVTPEGTPVTSVIAAVKQITRFFNSTYAELTAVENFIEYGGAGWNVLLDRTLNIGELTAEQWLDVFAQVVVAVNDKVGGGNSELFTVAELKQQLASSLEGSGITLDELFVLADKYATIKNIYLKAFVDSCVLDASTIPEGNLGKATFEALFDLGVADIQSIFEEIYKMGTGNADADIGNIPVKALETIVEAKFTADVDSKDLTDNIEIEDIKDLKLDSDVAEVGAYVTTKAAICTSKGKGGIVTIELGLGVNAADVVKIYDIYEQVITTGDITKLAGIDDLKTIKISVSDGTKDTWSHEYTVEEIVQIVLDQIGDVE